MTTELPSFTQSNSVKSKINPAFNSISTTLNIETTNTQPQQGMLLNRFENGNSQIKSMSFSQPQMYVDDDFIDFDKEQMNRIGFTDNSITIYALRYDMRDSSKTTETKMTFNAKNGKNFTFKELLDCVLEFEKVDRPKTLWFGGVDCHHVYFEGLHLNKNGSYSIFWGS